MSESDNKVVLDPESEKTLVQRIVDAVKKPTPPPKEQTQPVPPKQPTSTDLSEDEAAALADAIDQRIEDKLAEKKKPPEGEGEPPGGKPAEPKAAEPKPAQQKPSVETIESLKARIKELEAKPPPPEPPKGQPPADRPQFSDLAEEIAAEIVADPQAGFSTLFRTMRDLNVARRKKQ